MPHTVVLVCGLFYPECSTKFSIVCPANTSWVTTLCSCVSTHVQQLAEFRSVVATRKSCTLGPIRDLQTLEAARFCQRLSGALDVAGLPASHTDFSALNWIQFAAGNC